ncbi:hypothetical protein A3H03_01945 [Candidatus Kuenenbacteria bacterium RIFCSPLOWO2_12_FULL_42_13]|uniref:HEPN domain protein n=4 Tax=Candidatus Kueneniibacteriota TaxID=1752740 RepID=A0A0G0YTN7_9BACT|nr:MAG: HEPN domain protein [Candidatus Kuenenbacteria bacterium GW2011_GWA2_42_15]OGG89524.1 MAG: hypothetical protein A3C68_02365 [Candidatus Kuenenbacteria bacterium RIFCSPHIGHO2_02_FULL_42_29]OGG90716.1 MAG: hypothetical protein A3H55_00840 [Candidatus Kuenenbacteria bacterium RIFCSPLOWO2_02_FULL_42_16]OGG91736.1 MAG: hypothetical protein A3H03_01945 [Candidatus Kuenenbacteria bacterium RIFCSPLOWO2_12_FULL_42_13]OGG95667.1 MAG: hypothetical protein A2V95_00200 [Candidatus Kuenenbacteria bac
MTKIEQKQRDKKAKLIASTWLASADDDLSWAKDTLADGYYDRACFVSQQVAEKALKAYLLSKRQKLIKTHNLKLLLDEYKRFNKKFSDISGACKILSKYYIEARYPDDFCFNDFNIKEKAIEAINLARQVLNSVKSKIFTK